MRAKAGADVQDRTGDLVLTKDALCLLSYIGLRRPPPLRFAELWRDSLRLACLAEARARERRLERETAIEPATNSLEGCDSTTELLPPSRLADTRSPLRRGRPARRQTLRVNRSNSTPCGVARSATCRQTDGGGTSPPTFFLHRRVQPSARRREEGWWGGEGSNLRSPKAAGLQPAAIDRSATSPNFRLSCLRRSRASRGRRSTVLESCLF